MTATPLMSALSALFSHDFESALPYLRIEAERSNPDAAYLLAMLYKEGKGVAPSYHAFIRYLNQAAKHGSPQAHAELAMLAKTTDSATYLHHLHQAANADHIESMLTLSEEYLVGRRVLVSYRQANQWHQKAAQQQGQGWIYLGRDKTKRRIIKLRLQLYRHWLFNKVILNRVENEH